MNHQQSEENRQGDFESTIDYEIQKQQSLNDEIDSKLLRVEQEDSENRGYDEFGIGGRGADHFYHSTTNTTQDDNDACVDGIGIEFSDIIRMDDCNSINSSDGNETEGDEKDGLATTRNRRMRKNNRDGKRSSTSKISNRKSLSSAKNNSKKANRTGGKSTLNTTHLDPKVTIRIQKAEIESLTKQLENALQCKQDAELSLKDQAKVHKEDTKKMEMEITRINRRQNSRSANQKSKSDNADGDKIQNLRNENKALQTQVTSLKSLVQQATSQSHTRDKRLHRALESIDKFKTLLVENKTQHDDMTQHHHTKVVDLQARIKELEDEKRVLIIAHQKQNQLIDVIKRQKVLVEASRLLDFTEKEFESVLDLNWADTDGGE